MKRKITLIAWMLAAVGLCALCLFPPLNKDMRFGSGDPVAVLPWRCAWIGKMGPPECVDGKTTAGGYVVYRLDFARLGLLVGALAAGAAAVTLGAWACCKD